MIEQLTMLDTHTHTLSFLPEVRPVATSICLKRTLERGGRGGEGEGEGEGRVNMMNAVGRSVLYCTWLTDSRA